MSATPSLDFQKIFPAGMKHYVNNVNNTLDSFTAGDKIILEPEPTNKFDKNAIKLLWDAMDTAERIHIGYVPRDYTSPIHALLKEGLVVTGQVIKSGHGSISLSAELHPADLSDEIPF